MTPEIISMGRRKISGTEALVEQGDGWESLGDSCVGDDTHDLAYTPHLTTTVKDNRWELAKLTEPELQRAARLLQLKVTAAKRTELVLARAAYEEAQATEDPASEALSNAYMRLWRAERNAQ